MKKILKNHLIRNISRNIIFALLTIVFCLLTLLFNVIGFKYELEISNLNKFQYSYIIETNNENYINTSMYKLKSMNTVSNGNENVSVSIYVQNKPSIGHLQYDLLKPNEIIISNKVSNDLNLSVGDDIYLNLVNFDTPKLYKVADILNLNYDFYDIDKSLYYSYVCVGNDGELINNAKGVYCNFLNDLEYSNFMENNENYSQIYELDDDIRIFENRSIFFDSLSMILNIIIISLISLFLIKILKKENLKYKSNNFTIKKVDRFIKFDIMIYLFTPMMLLVLIYAIAYFINLISLISLLTFMTLAIVTSLICFLRRYFYENYI